MVRRRAASLTSATGPVPLSGLLDEALKQLQPLTSATESGDGILFSGNRQESVPRALFLDHRLTPLERNAWQVFRMLLNADGITAFPTYGQLRPYLTSMPCSGQASEETVARALTLLRLTRWLTLARHRRDPETGRIQGNLYVLHDEPLTPYEAIQLDPRYLELVSHALTHASKAIQRVGYYTLKEVTDDPLLSGRILPSRLQMVMQRLARQDWAQAALSSDSEGGTTTTNDDSLRNPKQDRTVRTDSINEEISTVPRARDHSHLRLPARFDRLRAEQQAGALAALQRIEMDLQQPVLDEWTARCQASTVRNPAGYLFGIIQKAMRGEFRAWASQRTVDRPEHAASTAARDHALDEIPARRELAQQHIAKLRAMLQIP